MWWLGVVVSKEWKKADFDHFRAFYGYCLIGLRCGHVVRRVRRGMGGGTKKHPYRVLLSDIGFATNYNIMFFQLSVSGRTVYV